MRQSENTGIPTVCNKIYYLADEINI
jgi:hypothetical protein